MLVRPQPTRLCYSNNAIKRRFQREMICLQIDQSKVKGFFDGIVGLTWLSNLSFLTGLEKREILNWEAYNTCTLTNMQYRQQTAVARVHNYLRIELFEKTVNTNENWFHQRKAAEGDDAPRDQPGTVRLVSSNSRPVLLIGGRLVGCFSVLFRSLQ